MNTRSSRKDSVFSIEQANAMLPLVRAITADLVPLFHAVMDRQQRLKRLVAGRNLEASDPYTDELLQIQEELHKDVEKLEGYIEELRELGVELKSPDLGLIDFPSVLDGQPILLCWQLGEAEVMHWHTLEGGFAERQPLPTAVVADSLESEF
jgi:hypothetical protein